MSIGQPSVGPNRRGSSQAQQRTMTPLYCSSPDFLSPGSLRSMSGNLAKFVAIRRTLSRVSKLGDHSLIPMNHSLIPISCAWRNSSSDSSATSIATIRTSSLGIVLASELRSEQIVARKVSNGPASYEISLMVFIIPVHVPVGYFSWLQSASAVDAIPASDLIICIDRA